MAMDLTGRIIGAESGGNPLARNPRSSAGGLGQFIDSTWLATVRKHRPDLAGRSNNDLLRLKFDPELSKQMTAAYASDNQGFLKSRGIDPNPGNTYLAHFAGPQGAAALHANPNAPVEQILGAKAVAANPFLRGKTGADVINWASGKVGGNAPASSYMARNAATQVQNGGPMAGPIGGAPVQGGPVPLTPPNQRYSKLADLLMAQAAGADVKGWGDALRALGGASLGYSLANKADTDQQAYQGKLAQALMSANSETLPQQLMATGDPQMVQQGVALKIAQGKKAEPMEIERRAIAGGLQPGTPEYRDFILKGGRGQTGEEYGTSTVPYIDKDGNVVYTQISKAGGRKDVQLPEGAKWATGVDKVDTGTGTVLLDKRTGQTRDTIQKDVAGEQAAQEVGKAAGGAQAAIPAAKTMVDNARKTIAELRAHPGLGVGTGASTLFDPRSWIPGTDAYDFQAKNKQAQGQSFMAARDALKGAGQVTDFEGQKGEQAIANLDTAQSKEQYLKALDTLESMMRKSYLDLERKAAGARAQSAAPAVEAPPVDALKQKYGLE